MRSSATPGRCWKLRAFQNAAHEGEGDFCILFFVVGKQWWEKKEKNKIICIPHVVPHLFPTNDLSAADTAAPGEGGGAPKGILLLLLLRRGSSQTRLCCQCKLPQSRQRVHRQPQVPLSTLTRSSPPAPPHLSLSLLSPSAFPLFLFLSARWLIVHWGAHRRFTALCEMATLEIAASAPLMLKTVATKVASSAHAKGKLTVVDGQKTALTIG
jgi:hypothetical protein